MAREFPVNIPITAKNLAKDTTAQIFRNLDRLESKLAKVNQRGQQFQAVGRTFQQAGRSMIVAGVGIGAGLGVATAQASGFERGMGRVATLIDGDASVAFREYGSLVENLSIRAGRKVGTLNDALFQTISAGVQAGEEARFLTASTRLAVGGFTDEATAVDGLSRLYNAYGKNIEDVEFFSGQLFLTNKKGITTIEALGKNVGTLAGQFSAVGVPSGDFLAALASITKFAPNTEVAVTRLQAILNAVKKPSTDAVAILNELNKTLPKTERVALSIESLRQEGLVGFFKKLQKATGGSSLLMDKLFNANVRAANGIAALNLDSKEFIANAELMQDRTALVALAQQKFDDVNKLAFSRFSQGLETLKAMTREIGKALLPTVTSLMSVFARVGGGVLTFMKNNQGLIRVLAFVAAGFSAVLIVGGSLLAVLGTILVAAGGFIAAWASIQTVLAVAIPIIQGIIGFISLLGIKFIAIGAAIAFAVGLVATFVAGFVSGFLRGIMPVLKVVGGAIGSFFGMLFDWIKKVLKAIGGLFKFIFKIGNKLGFALGSGISALLGVTETTAEKTVKVADKAGSKVEKLDKSTQKKITSDRVKELERRIALMQKTGEKTKTKGLEAIDIFAGGAAGRFLTGAFTGAPVGEESDQGFATKEIKRSAAAAPVNNDNRRIVQIDKLELPGVRDVEDFLVELDKLSIAPGVG